MINHNALVRMSITNYVDIHVDQNMGKGKIYWSLLKSIEYP